MIKTLVIAASCLFIVVSTSSDASTPQLPAPTHAVCPASASPAPAQDLLFASRAALTCGPKCFASEGGTTSTLSGFGGTCAASVSALAAELKSAADTACRNSTGFIACNVVRHDTGCLPDGDPQYFIDQGYATYNCIDTTC